MRGLESFSIKKASKPNQGFGAEGQLKPFGFLRITPFPLIPLPFKKPFEAVFTA